MKPLLQFATSLLALAGLLAGPAASATNIAELPLKASVLAKPNVIWGLDDSGSMDFEVMLKTNDGAFWWDSSNGTGYSNNQPIFYDAGVANSQYRKYAYLFPNGSANGARELLDSTYDHFAAMPSGQFAWLRSPDYNPLYFNPSATYKPWSPAYIGTTVQSFGNATPTAAKSHPLYTPTLDLTANQPLTNATDFTFTAYRNMVIPPGARYCERGSSMCGQSVTNWNTAGVNGFTPTDRIYRVSMAYFPATYYRKETCTPNADGSCVTNFDGATLKRYEIKPANYRTTDEYQAAIQNFANWFQYYRKRKLMLSAAVGQVLEPLTGMRMGVVKFNNLSSVTMYDIDATDAAANGRRVAGIVYQNASSGGTPTRETLKYIGGQFTGNSSVIEYACQRNNAFIITDGFAYANAISPPSYTKATWGSGVPYETTYSNTLADLALAYYTINLRPSMATGKVPPTLTDTNPNLHLNTYAMTLGARGTIYVDESTPLPTAASDWPNPNADRSPTAVDDLWHATINGRGKMYTASTPTETSLRIQAAMNDMLNAVGAQSGIAVSTVNLTRGDGFAYMATYNPSGWSGDLTANAIDSATAVISRTATWSADAKLRTRSTPRQIATLTGSGGAAFTADNVGSLINPTGSYGDNTELVAYLRGDRSLENTTYRRRTSLIGAVITAEPVISRADNVVYLASGEGMLHAIDINKASATAVGQELWAFVPNAVLPDIGQTAQRGYTFKTQLDGSPVIGKTGTDSRLLVAGMGAAGRAYYALDVSTPRANTEANAGNWVKWQFPGASTASYTGKVGQTLGKPSIVKVGTDYRVLVTSGYNATADGLGRLFVLDAADGSVVKEYVTTEGALGAEAGLTHVSAYVEDDGTVQYVYGGDLLGNLWRFDLSLAPSVSGAVKKLATLTDAAGNPQPVTSPPELAEINSKRVVLVGTGRLLDVTDFGSTRTQTFYAIADGTTLTGARGSLKARTYTRDSGTGDGTVTGDTVDWATQRGWYMDLPAGEQQNTRSSLAYGTVAFTTNVAGRSDCSASSWLYVLDFKTGKRYDNDTPVSSQISSTSNASGPNNVVTDNSNGTGDGGVKILVQTGSGDPETREGARRPVIPAAKNSWREIRR